MQSHALVDRYPSTQICELRTLELRNNKKLDDDQQQRRYPPPTTYEIDDGATCGLYTSPARVDALRGALRDALRDIP